MEKVTRVAAHYIRIWLTPAAGVGELVSVLVSGNDSIAIVVDTVVIFFIINLYDH